MLHFKWFFISVLVVLMSCKSSKSSTVDNDTKIDGHISENDIDRNISKELPYFINSRHDTIYKIVLSSAEWKNRLNDAEYNVLREKGTERAFTGDLVHHKEVGIYTCRGCGLPLFASKHKFDSGTGWPSFYDVYEKTAISKDTDYDLGYARTELSCSKCGGHQGHVFTDGPKPTGLRYCINAVSLNFIKTEH
jgi:peptide-methionine (R)-S-oxide reductase